MSVRRSVGRLVGPLFTCPLCTFSAFLIFLCSQLLPKCLAELYHCSCPPARDWGSRVSGLVQCTTCDVSFEDEESFNAHARSLTTSENNLSPSQRPHLCNSRVVCRKCQWTYKKVKGFKGVLGYLWMVLYKKRTRDFLVA